MQCMSTEWIAAVSLHNGIYTATKTNIAAHNRDEFKTDDTE